MGSVYEIALKRIHKLKGTFTNFAINDLKEVILVAALFHDFGKATSFFQDYLEKPDRASTEIQRLRRSHGLISAFMTFGVLREKIPENLVLQLFGLIIVRRHHGNLRDFNELLTFDPKELENIGIQLDNLDFDEVKNIVSPYGYANLVSRDFISNAIQYFLPRTPRGIRRLNRTFTVEHYFALDLLYSILLYADKTDAILNGMQVDESRQLKSEYVEQFKNNLPKDPENRINIIRQNAFDSAAKSIESLADEERILSINIPTGSGKTITSLNAALKLCEKFEHDHIVYCLPFTSVIDQNFDVIEKICRSADLQIDSGTLLKHHHLTDIVYNSLSDSNVFKEYLPNEALHLIESWESRITVTTFVQFALSLISYKNSSLKKFHRFSNAVIILDEVQSIPHHYWKLIRDMFKNMVRLLNSRIILVTATMPLIFAEEKNEIKELIQNKKQLFEQLNRIELDITNLKNEEMEWDEFCNLANKLIVDNSSKNILFVMNTIRAAQDLYSLFDELNIEHKLEFLSAHVIPKQRLKRIKDIKDHNYERPVIVVSTQLVEAGVDIDLDIVVRDFAPVDHIFQTCGRCNRENSNNIKGKVILFSLKDSNGWIPSRIYDTFLKQKTKKTLGNNSIIPESDFFDLANRYYNEIQTGGSQRLSEELLDRIKSLKYNDGDNAIELNLIDDNYSSPVFIELDELAKEYWVEYQNVLDMEGGFEKNAKLKQTKAKIAEYIINVPQKCLPAGYSNGIYRIEKEEVDQYYHPVTGFKLDSVLPEKTETCVF